MPKSKSFSIEWALDQVTELFLKHGYAAVSGRQIGEALGVSRSTVYGTFDTKWRLFVRVLRRYGPARVPGLSELRGAPSPRAALKRVFEHGKQRRCLVLNMLLDRPAGDPEIARLVEDAVLDLEERFGDAIERGRSAGEIADSVDAVQAGRALLGLYLGRYVLVRSGAATEPVLRAVVRQVEAMLPRARR